MIDVSANQIDCDLIRKISIKQLNPDNTTSEITIYFRVDTMEQVTEQQAALCPNIQSLDIDCANICNT